MKILIAYLVIILFCGCASLACREDPHDYCTTVYPGVTYDLGHIAGTNPNDGRNGALGRFPRGFLITVSIVDLPFSFILDTVALPVDLVSLSAKDASKE